MSSSTSGPSRSEENLPSTSSQEKEMCKSCKIERPTSEFISGHYSKFNEEMHEFCLFCLTYLLRLDGYPATCIFCGVCLKDEDYFHVLPPNLKSVTIMQKEEKAIPTKERVYCANPKCSALHSKTEARVPKEEILKLDYDASGLAECKKCKQRFCLNCCVSWHDSMSCKDYKNSVICMEQENDERKLLLLAAKNFWVRCNECGRIIDHEWGCDTVHCRCGHSFKNKNRRD